MFGQNGLLTFMKAMRTSQSQFENEEVLQDFALKAYSDCCEWFGPPPDPEFRFKLVSWHRSMCSRDPVNRRYVLLISDSGGLEATCSRIGHEMYHRVTWQRSGMRKKLWVDEMLAWVTAYSIMRLRGMEYNANAMEQACVSPDRLAVARLRNVRRPFRIGQVTWAPTFGYPENFNRDVIRLGKALSVLCSRDTVFKLGFSATATDWVATIPHIYQHPIRAILGFEEPRMDMDSVNPNTRFLYYKAYGYALYWIGDFDAAIEALQIACGYRTEDTDIHLYLGNALWQANRHQEAMQTLRQGLKKAPSSIGLRYTIGNYARAQRDFPAAAEEYRALALLNSKDSAAGYYLGLTLYDMGAFKEAETVLKAIKFDSDRENQELLRLLTLVSIATKN